MTLTIYAARRIRTLNPARPQATQVIWCVLHFN